MNKPKQLLILTCFLCSFFRPCGQVPNSSGMHNRKLLDSVTKTLETIYEMDQAPRAAIDSIAQKYGNNSEEMRNHWKFIHSIDSNNLLKVKTILDQYGWLSNEETSDKAHDALWLVIQHSDLNTQLKYLPLLESTVRKGKAKAKRYAYLVDRILTSQGKFQVYGSQFQVNPSGKTFAYPIADEPNVNQRRMQVGLDSLEIYAKALGINYKATTQDSYKGKVVVMAIISDTAHRPMSDVVVYLNEKLLAKTDETGELFIVIDKNQKGNSLQLKKEGYLPAMFTLVEEKDVFEFMFVMSKQ